MAITYRKLRRKLIEDNIDKEKLTDTINYANQRLFKKPLPNTIVSRIYKDGEISMTQLEMLCSALNYDIKEIFETVTETELAAIKKELKSVQKPQAPRKKAITHKTFVYGESIEGISVGDYVVFGEYPYTERGDAKPLQWIVMEINEDKLFLVSRYVIDVMQYHEKNRKVSWNNSPIRSWLNKDFINIAFLQGLEDTIISTRIEFCDYGNGDFCRIENSGFCFDKIFLLGYGEILKYWPTPSYAKAKKMNNGVSYAKRKATLTPYAKTKEYIDPLAIEYCDHHIYNYLLRDTVKNCISCVISKPALGSANPWGFYSHKNTIPDGIRPAMWVKK